MSAKRGGRKDATRLAHTGRAGAEHHGVVSPPVYHASTVTFPTVAALREATAHPYEGMFYGRHGTPTTRAFEDAMAAIEGGGTTLALPSGLSACTTALLAVVQPGDHLLMVDSAYSPTRRFCNSMLKELGVETTFYAPSEPIDGLLRANTRAVFLESPGSFTFEIQDTQKVVEAARTQGAVTLMDNTWATPLFCKPLALGVDISIQAVTKFVGGHSDLMMGTITASGKLAQRVRSVAAHLGLCAAPDDCWLALRGLRSLAARLERHQESGLRLADWLAARPEVVRVLHPARKDDPGHLLWRRDFTGAPGLFGVVLKPVPDAAVAAMLDGLDLFAMGYSWGGFESLILPADPRPFRTAVPWQEPGPLLRIHTGLEDVDDLIADLAAGFDCLNAAP